MYNHCTQGKKKQTKLCALNIIGSLERDQWAEKIATGGSVVQSLYLNTLFLKPKGFASEMILLS